MLPIWYIIMKYIMILSNSNNMNTCILNMRNCSLMDYRSVTSFRSISLLSSKRPGLGGCLLAVAGSRQQALAIF